MGRPSGRVLRDRYGDRRPFADHLAADVLARRHEPEGVVEMSGDGVVGVMPQSDRRLRMVVAKSLPTQSVCF